MASTKTYSSSSPFTITEERVQELIDHTIGTSTIKEGRVKELAEQIIRAAVRDQARDLEKHFLDIHSRLLNLEK